MKNLVATYSAPNGHWVGNGFPVRSLLSYDRMGPANISPFLLLDYAGPTTFPPGTHRRGVGQHPHRGFETVTLVLKGELEHRDSTGSGGLIGEGDVQWMTAGAGIVHEEFHSPEFTKRGGELEMVQLWVNLPAKSKSAPAAYQTLLENDIPAVSLGEQIGQLRVIAGDYKNHVGPAKTFTSMNVWDLKLEPAAKVVLPVPEWHNCIAAVLTGTALANGMEVLREADVAVFGRDGQELQLETNNHARLLVLTGEPIDEPVAGYGPFVMNSESEIRKAITDYNNGEFGVISR